MPSGQLGNAEPQAAPLHKHRKYTDSGSVQTQEVYRLRKYTDSGSVQTQEVYRLRKCTDSGSTYIDSGSVQAGVLRARCTYMYPSVKVGYTIPPKDLPDFVILVPNLFSMLNCSLLELLVVRGFL